MVGVSLSRKCQTQCRRIYLAPMFEPYAVSLAQSCLNIKPIPVLGPASPPQPWRPSSCVPRYPVGVLLRTQLCFCYLGLLFLPGKSVEWTSWNSAQTSHPWPRSVCSSQCGKCGRIVGVPEKAFCYEQSEELGPRSSFLICASPTPTLRILRNL